MPFVPAASVAQSSASTSSTTQTLNVNANLVVVPVTVRDNKERLVRTLMREDFTLAVDGKPQAIRYFDREDDLPLTVGLLVDVSGSQRTVLDAERTASAAFLDGMLQPDRDRVFVVQFGRTADLLADITPSIPKLQAALQKIDADEDRPSFRDGNPPPDDQGSKGNTQDNGGTQDGSGRTDNGGSGGRGRRGGSPRSGSTSGGGTVLYDAVFLSSDEVLKKAPSKNGQTRKAIILLTDGDDRGSKESVADAIEAAQRTDATLYAIYYKGEDSRGGFGNGGGFPGGRRGSGFPGGRGGGFPGGGGGGYPGGGGGRERVDGKTGGRVYEVTKKMTLPEIYKEIAEELRSQYRIGFSPASSEEGFHKVSVDVPKQKKVILQARSGYYTGAAAK